jgi:beta-barrel assembly-enhancing protease
MATQAATRQCHDSEMERGAHAMLQRPPSRHAAALKTASHHALWRRSLIWSLCLLMALGGGPLPAVAQERAAETSAVRLPSLGESASDDLSVGAERRLGEQIMREARRDPDLLDDPVLQDYLWSVFNPLVAAARKLGHIDADIDTAFAWEAFLVRDRSVNAFALPGGYVGVHLGLIAITTTSDQLASVLAHEITHVTQRHIARSIAPQQRASIVAIAGLILGLIAASRSNNVDVANAAIYGSQGAAIQSQLNYSRDAEREADRIGYAVLSAAGFAPRGMAAMFERLDAASRLSDNGSFPYLRSHPLTTDRISEARSRTLFAPGAASVPSLQHSLMQMRSRVLMAEGAQGLQRINGSTASVVRADRITALYGGALAASLQNNHAQARAMADQAWQLAAAMAPREPEAERGLRLLQAQVALAQGDAAAAMLALDALPSLPTPANSANIHERPALLLRAQASLALQRSNPGAPTVALRSSTEALQTWLSEHAQDAAAWELAASCSEALGLKLRAMRAAAEARFVVGDLPGAIDRLRAAQQVSRAGGNVGGNAGGAASVNAGAGQDFIEASVIDARLRSIVALRRQLQLEARGDTRTENRGGNRPGDEPPLRPTN